MKESIELHLITNYAWHCGIYQQENTQVGGYGPDLQLAVPGRW